MNNSIEYNDLILAKDGKFDQINLDKTILSTQDEYGNTILMYAIFYEKKDVVDNILNIINKDLLIIQESDKCIIEFNSIKELDKYTIEFNSIFNAKNKEGSNCITIACYVGNISIIRSLINFIISTSKYMVKASKSSSLAYNISYFESMFFNVFNLFFSKNKSNMTAIDYLLHRIEMLNDDVSK